MDWWLCCVCCIYSCHCMPMRHRLVHSLLQCWLCLLCHRLFLLLLCSLQHRLHCLQLPLLSDRCLLLG